MTTWQYWLGTVKPTISSDQPKTLPKSFYEILKILYLTEFYSD